MGKEINYRYVFAQKTKYKQQWLKLNPNLNNESGIYVLIRYENGFKYGYVGQALHILDRLVSHSEGTEQHIDKSLKKHKLYDEYSNPTGYKVMFKNYPPEELNDKEFEYVKYYANKGVQLRNKTSGSQGEGKFGISDNKESKGYREGIARGKYLIKQELKPIIEKYLNIELKKDNKLSQRMLDKFWAILN